MKIALGVTGSISAYKALDLTRKFTKEGHQVRVILTRGAEKFVRSETFAYLGAEKVYSPEDDFRSYSGEEGPVLHVSLAKWADKFLVAPLSANTLSAFAHAQANDLLTSLFLAWRKEKPILIFPAMNTEMLTHPFVQENLDRVSSLPFVFLGKTQKGLLACGDEGSGKLATIDEIAELTYSFDLLKINKHLLLTAGATISPVDEVRFLTNGSTGKTAVPLIRKALSQGMKVTAVVGKNATAEIDSFVNHPNFHIERVTTTSDMKSSVHKYFLDCDYYVSSAAIGDIEFPRREGKLKKSQMKDSLTIKKAPDVLASILEIKKDHQVIVGFAAEKELSNEVLTEKFQRKPVDLLVGTQVNSGVAGTGEALGFGANEAQYRFMKNLSDISELQALSKEQLGDYILSFLLTSQTLEKHEELH